MLSTSYNTDKLYKPSRSKVGVYFFSHRVINMWNSLLDSVSFSSLRSFKSALNTLELNFCNVFNVIAHSFSVYCHQLLFDQIKWNDNSKLVMLIVMIIIIMIIICADWQCRRCVYMYGWMLFCGECSRWNLPSWRWLRQMLRWTVHWPLHMDPFPDRRYCCCLSSSSHYISPPQGRCTHLMTCNTPQLFSYQCPYQGLAQDSAMPPAIIDAQAWYTSSSSRSHLGPLLHSTMDGLSPEVGRNRSIGVAELVCPATARMARQLPAKWTTGCYANLAI